MENRQNPGAYSLDEIHQENHDSGGTPITPQALHGSEEENARGEDPEEEACELCGGTGEMTFDEYDPDSHNYTRGTGIKKCLCRL